MTGRQIAGLGHGGLWGRLSAGRGRSGLAAVQHRGLLGSVALPQASCLHPVPLLVCLSVASHEPTVIKTSRPWGYSSLGEIWREVGGVGDGGLSLAPVVWPSAQSRGASWEAHCRDRGLQAGGQARSGKGSCWL